MNPTSSKMPEFLSGGGEMGALTRAKDWGATSLGSVESWPQSLRTSLSIVLNSRFPMFLWWGPDLICFYNDAYRPSLGQNGKHPDILGMRAEEAWKEIWHIIGPLVQRVLRGEGATWDEDLLVPIYRNGKVEDVYWTFSYSPVKDELGEIKGVLVICSETTEKINTLKHLKESNTRFLNNIIQAPVAMCIFRGANHVVEIANEMMLQLWGTTADKVLNKPIFDGLPEAAGQGLEQLIDHVFKTGETFRANERPVLLPRGTQSEYTYINFVYEALKEPNGTISGIVAIAIEVTAQVIARQKIEESEERFRTMAEGSDILIAVADEHKTATYFNKAWADLTGRKMEDLLNRGWADLIHPQDRDKFVNIYLNALEKKIDFAGEFRIMNKEGGYSWLLANGPARFRTDGSFSGHISSCIDITQRKEAEDEKQKLIAIMDASHEFIGLADTEGNAQYVNPAGLKMLGWGNLQGRKIMDCVYPEDRLFAAEILPGLLADGNFQHEIRFWNEKTGVPFWLQWNGITIRDDTTGQVVGLATISPDITERKTAENALVESEKRFRSLVHSAPFPMALYIGEEMYIELANQSIIDIWGKGKDVVGKLFTEILPELAEQKVFDQIREVYKTGKAFHIQNQPLNIIVDGEPRVYYFHYSFTPVKDSTGKIFGVMNTGVDLTALNIAKQKVEESEKRFKKVADNAPVMIWMSGTDNVRNFFNSAWLSFTGKTIEQESNNGWLDGMHPEDLEKCAEMYRAALANKCEFGAEYRLKRYDGEYRWLASRGVPRFTPQGDFEGYIGAALDIQAQKTFTSELEKQVAERTWELKQKNIQLESTNKELQSFAYVSSHDLQEPLRKIQTYAALVLEREVEQLSPKGKSYFVRMQEAAGKMQKLINDLLSYSRSTDSEGQFEETHLQDIVDEVKKELGDIIERKNAIIETHGLCKARIIPFQIRQLMINLINNSLKFAKQGVVPHITMTCKISKGKELNVPQLTADKSYCHVSLQDNGIGFEPEYNQKIFEVFQRLHAESEYSGTGIGLAIVKKIVESHAGYITASGQLNAGVVFDIYLPA